VCDYDTAIVAERRGGWRSCTMRLPRSSGGSGPGSWCFGPAIPGQGQVERTNGYLERSFLSLREFSDLFDL
jgi:hypothetical protein